MTRNERTRKAVDRLEIVSSYLSRGHDATMFARLYNAGDILRQLREETGPVDAEDLDRWASICMGVAEDAAREDGGEAELIGLINAVETAGYQVDSIFQSCRAALAAERKKAETGEAVIRSLNRYIETLEGRDVERVRRIRELEALCETRLIYADELRKQLSGVLPQADFFVPAKTGAEL